MVDVVDDGPDHLDVLPGRVGLVGSPRTGNRADRDRTWCDGVEGDLVEGAGGGRAGVRAGTMEL